MLYIDICVVWKPSNYFKTKAGETTGYISGERRRIE